MGVNQGPSPIPPSPVGPSAAEWGVSHHRLWSKGLVSPFDRSLLLCCTWAHWGWRPGGLALAVTQTSPEQLDMLHPCNLKGSQQIKRQPTCTRPFTTAVCGGLSCLKLFQQGRLSKINSCMETWARASTAVESAPWLADS